jgi:hypothetical protein
MTFKRDDECWLVQPEGLLRVRILEARRSKDGERYYDTRYRIVVSRRVDDTGQVFATADTLFMNPMEAAKNWERDHGAEFRRVVNK